MSKKRTSSASINDEQTDEDSECKLMQESVRKFIRSIIQAISIAPLHVHYYSEALPKQHGYCAGISRLSTTGNCE